MKTVLFACVHNAGRSQMAAAWFNALVDASKARAISAGTHPGTHVHPEVVVAMQEVGIDLAHASTTTLTPAFGQQAQVLITMGCGDECPFVPGALREDWPIEDPKGKPAETVRRIRDEVRTRVEALIAREGWALKLQPPLLAGGNPQIAKADGNAPVQAYIAAMPGWKRNIGRRLDAIIVRTVPGVQKAVKWNSPFYGVEGKGWFLNFHCFTRYVKVAFFRGKSLRPAPPGESRHKDVRYLDIHEDDELDETQLAAWVKQASKLPGWKV